TGASYNDAQVAPGAAVARRPPRLGRRRAAALVRLAALAGRRERGGAAGGAGVAAVDAARAGHGDDRVLHERPHRAHGPPQPALGLAQPLAVAAVVAGAGGRWDRGPVAV